MKKLITKIRNLRWKLIFAALALVLLIVVPLLINEGYKTDRIIYTTMWDAADVLAYYGTVLASGGAAVGVWFSVRAANKNYQDDVRARVLPFIAVTPFEQKAVVDTMALLKEKVESHKKAEDSANTSAVQYEEYKLSRIYFVITKRGIDTMKKLSKTQQTLLEHAGTMWVSQAGGGETLQRTEFYSIPLEIENVGNGTAANLRIGFNREGESKRRFVRPMMLK